MSFAIVGASVFDGEAVREGLAVVVDGARISALVPRGDLPKGTHTHELEGLLAPGFIDVQVNGGGGVLFNETPSVEGIRTIGAAHRRFGTTSFLPTLISDTREKMTQAVEAARAGLAEGVPGLLGVHLEGPFLNPVRKGVHDPKTMRPIEDEDIRVMASLGAGRTLVTLAPEMVPLEAIARLAQAGVVVSAGHTEASYEVLEVARKAGLRGYTHLFNAMPPLASREPGPLGAALSEDDTWLSLITDMHHVSAPSLKVSLAAKDPRKVMLVTDAMPTVGTDAETFMLQGRTVFRRNGRLTTEDGTLAGSDLDMATAVRNAVTKLGVSLPAALRMAALNPATFLRLDDELGRIAPGYRASLVLLDDALQVRRTWVDGVEDQR